MKINFHNFEYNVSHWKKFGNSYFRELYPQNFNILLKSRSSGATSSIFSSRDGAIYLTYYHHTASYNVLGNGLLVEIADMFNLIYDYPTYTSKQLEVGKMDITNFIIKYKKLYLYS